MEKVLNQSEVAINFSIRKRATWKFILFFVITNGYYIYFWLWKFVKDFNALQIDVTNKINFWKYAVFIIAMDIFDLYHTIITWNSEEFTRTDKLIWQTYGLIFLLITYCIAKHLEKYALDRYNTTIKHNALAMWFLGIFYANFTLNTFEERVQKSLLAKDQNN